MAKTPVTEAMPLKYAVVWGVIVAAVVAAQQLSASGWPPASFTELLATVLIGGAIGGYIMARIYWGSLRSRRQR